MAVGVRRTFGQYVPLDSHLHRLEPLVKIIVFCSVLAGILLSVGWVQLGFLLAYILFLCLISKVRLAFYIGNLKYFTWMFALSFAINIIFPRGTAAQRFSLQALNVAGIFSVRLVLMILAASVMTVVTAPSEIGDSILVFSRIKGRVGRWAAEFASLLSISLRFVPVMFEEAERIKAAQTLRGQSMSGLANKVKSATGLVIPLIDSSLRRAGNLGFALEARCYGYKIPTRPRLRFGGREAILTSSSILVLLGIVIMR
jgi:energy-coupling factor transport system permease protein